MFLTNSLNRVSEDPTKNVHQIKNYFDDLLTLEWKRHGHLNLTATIYNIAFLNRLSPQGERNRVF